MTATQPAKRPATPATPAIVTDGPPDGVPGRSRKPSRKAPQPPTATTAKQPPVVADDGFGDVLHVCEQAFRLHHPEARAMAGRLRDRHKLTAAGLRRRGAAAQAADYERMAGALDGLLRRNRKKTLYREERLGDPTPHRAPKPWQEDPIERLFEDERIDAGEKAAAERIAAVYRGLWSPKLTGALDMIGMGGSSGGGVGHGIERMPERLARWYMDSYRPWCAWMATGEVAYCTGCWRVYPHARTLCPLCSTRVRGKRMSRAAANLPLVIDVAVDGVALKTARGRYGVSWMKALMLLKGGLRAYARVGK